MNEQPKKERIEVDLNFLRETFLQIRLIYRLIKDPQVPFYLKLLPFVSVIYLLSPLDFVPDAFIGLGQLDDVGVLFLGARTFLQLTPPYLVEKHRTQLLLEDGYITQDEIQDAIIIDGDDVIIEKPAE